MTQRFGDWQTTASGITFWPLDPRPEEIAIEDIAHHLSRICRWGGATKNFYSVAEHSVLLAAYFDARQGNRQLARWALLHDAAEAYLGDVVRPLKPYFAEFSRFESLLERMIWQRYGLDGELPAEVKAADTAIIGDERDQLFTTSLHARQKRQGETGLGIDMAQWPPEQASGVFLATYRRLFGEG